jgi:hypothetical protein
MITLELHELPVVAREPLLVPPDLIHEGRQLRRDLHRAGLGEGVVALTEIAQGKVEASAGRGAIQPPLPDLRPVNHPVPDHLEELPEIHFVSPATRAPREGTR